MGSISAATLARPTGASAQSDANAFSAVIADGLFNFVTITPDKGKLSDTDMTYSLFVGYQFVPWLAVEAGYMDLGKEEIRATGTYTYNVNPNTVPPPPTGGTYRSDLNFESSGWAAVVAPHAADR